MPGSLVQPVMQRIIRAYCRRVVRRRFHLRVEGGEHLPARGPVLLACRHYHAAYDGMALLATVPRPLHLLIALDWLRAPLLRWGMRAACRAVRWPVVLRAEGLRAGGAPQPARQAQRTIRQALQEATALLASGEVLAIFPEGFPTVDPVYTPKQAAEDLLPFRAGYLTILRLAQRQCAVPIAVVPVGVVYAPHAAGQRSRLTLRFGPPQTLAAAGSLEALGRAVEAAVRTLSAPEAPSEGALAALQTARGEEPPR